ncbi:restriction endonuclease subunit S [[Ruminococcus] torques]|uniref:restriction endonuclease subunit S n=1 Tax=[Ruminococcus] torques TaxID=33039 RepID=UPI00307B2158
MTGQQLKNSILQMAVQGKLVPQDPNDEPASVLLARIRKEKEELIKAGKIKKEKNPSYIFRGADNLPYEKVGKNEPVCIADEVPFDIPESWEWIKISDVFQTVMGQSPRGDSVSNLKNGMEFHQGKVFFGEKYISTSDQTTVSPTKIAEPDSILLCVRAPVGKVNITNRTLCIGRGLCALKPLGGINIDFAFHLLEVYENIFVKQATGTTFVAITGEVVKNQIVPLPPLSEQARIVSKIKELLPLLSQYQNAEIANKKLLKDFPALLKKSILQEAVQGKLVPQDPTDEPAPILLERIRAEKQKLIAEGKIKKDKHESIIFRRDNSHYEKLDGIEHCIDDEIPFDIPESWVWVRFFSVIDIATNLVRPDTYADYMHIAPDNIEKATGVLLECRTVQQDKVVSPNHMFYKGQIIYSKIRPLLRKAVIAPFDGLCSADMYPLNTSVNKEYLLRYILSDTFNLQVATTMSSRVKMPKINQDELSNILIPIPPIQEQERIISRVKELFDKITLI